MSTLPRRLSLRLATLAALVSATLVPVLVSSDRPTYAAVPQASSLSHSVLLSQPAHFATGAAHAAHSARAAWADRALLATASSPAGLTSFIASIDTMKESRDTLNNPLTDAQIMEDVTTTASLGANYVTVDVPYDYPSYMARWVNAARTAGLHVWFRSTFDDWERIYTSTVQMTPSGYITALTNFIAAHPSLYKPGDILDPLPEPENSSYWASKSPYGNNWGWYNAPNATTDEFNRFFVDLTSAARTALQNAGITGVTTNIRSVAPWWAYHPLSLYPATIAAMGNVAIDIYDGQSPTISPSAALLQLQDDITNIEQVSGVPIILGEYGYSIDGVTTDAQQEAVVKPQLDWLRTQPYIQGMNWWHGAGYPAPDTINGARLFSGTIGAWTPRPAAFDLADFFSAELHTPNPTATSIAADKIVPIASTATATLAPSATTMAPASTSTPPPATSTPPPATGTATTTTTGTATTTTTGTATTTTTGTATTTTTGTATTTTETSSPTATTTETSAATSTWTSTSTAIATSTWTATSTPPPAGAPTSISTVTPAAPRPSVMATALPRSTMITPMATATRTGIPTPRATATARQWPATRTPTRTPRTPTRTPRTPRTPTPMATATATVRPHEKRPHGTRQPTPRPPALSVHVMTGAPTIVQGNVEMFSTTLVSVRTTTHGTLNFAVSPQRGRAVWWARRTANVTPTKPWTLTVSWHVPYRQAPGPYTLHVMVIPDGVRTGAGIDGAAAFAVLRPAPRGGPSHAQSRPVIHRRRPSTAAETVARIVV